MTVHAFRFSMPTAPGKSAVRNDVKNKVFGSDNAQGTQSLTEALPDQAGEAVVLNTAGDGSGDDYIRGLHRAETTFEDKQDVIESVEQNLLRGKSWYRLEYHECNNDDNQPCDGWQVEVEHGTLPSGL